ncbi:hypothetical protein QA612_03505 [Evansella sp. AB-P1]|uniref:hypothetical protein n=1 Tax=Evansella sp. AB-P1 TaxID=3037653 RepID=UPI00241D94AC|nr:hypothetical protein [Evansella sp. AB-P1]MDG5786544.1 hypothetical protein [Evansella sp. AB-P1]
MNLIESLLGNPFLLFFLIAALLSFFQGFGKKKEDQQQSGNKGPQEKPKKEEIDWREIFKQEQEPPKQEPKRPPSQPRRQETYTASIDVEHELNKGNKELNDRYEKAKQRKREVLESTADLSDSPIIKGDITKSSSKIDLSFSKISREEAVKGIIWSEVLGKPKARKHS